MESNQADYTNTFCYLMKVDTNNNEIYNEKNFINWLTNWKKRILINNGSKENSINLMKKNNPIIIPRNHKVEEALEAANNNDLKKINKLLHILINHHQKIKVIKHFVVLKNIILFYNSL
jgi:uncharacterized protein YdiU (UPF0061 family)